jgi:hypothetical protein
MMIALAEERRRSDAALREIGEQRPLATDALFANDEVFLRFPRCAKLFPSTLARWSDRGRTRSPGLV